MIRPLKPVPASSHSSLSLPFADKFPRLPASPSRSGPLPFNKISLPLNSLVATLPQVFIPNNLKSFICNAYKKSGGRVQLRLTDFRSPVGIPATPAPITQDRPQPFPLIHFRTPFVASGVGISPNAPVFSSPLLARIHAHISLPHRLTSN